MTQKGKARPQCFWCGRFVPIGQGITTKFEHKDNPERKTYLCDRCATDETVEEFKNLPWYKGHQVV